jgi:beta-fructofuranosidase
MSVPRPTLHYTPPTGWVNDPLALTYHDGRYHLFFQFLPDRTTWDLACEWGHATSPDLLTWETQPVALRPGDGEDGVWSGSLVRPPGGDAVVFYTAVDAVDADQGRVRRALPTDATWLSWTKEAVVLGPPEDGSARAIRDPFVTSYDGGWRMLLAGGRPDGSGALWTSRSADLTTWSPPVLAASGTDQGSLWECPSLMIVDGRAVLVLSVGGPGDQHAMVGALVEEHGDRLAVGPWQRLTFGPSLYAASAFTDADGRWGLISWLRGVGDADAGWMGAHSLPYRVFVDGGRVALRPHPVVEGRRAAAVAPGVLPPVADLEWAPRPGEALESAGLFRAEAREDAVVVSGHELPWAGEPLRLVLDGPVLEVFGDHGVLAVPVRATGSERPLAGNPDRVTVYRLT